MIYLHLVFIHLHGVYSLVFAVLFGKSTAACTSYDLITYDINNNSCLLATVTAKNMANLVASLSFVENISHTVVLTDNNYSLLWG